MKTIIVLTALFSTITAIEIHCTFQHWKVPRQYDYLYLCAVSGVHVTENKDLERVVGTSHEKGKSDADVQVVSFTRCNNMTFIPQNIHKIFPNIIALMFDQSCKIETLNGDELKDYVNLEWFVISDNPLKRIPGNLFEFNPKLKNVNFHQNEIEHVGSNLLNHLENLTTAHFLGNACISQTAYKSRAEVLELIEALDKKCPDSE
jgi:hypothetical protein